MRTALVSLFLFLSVACGGSAPAAATDPTAATTAASSDAEPKCAKATIGGGDDMTACISSCEKLDEKAPEGSRCLSLNADCTAQCNHKFKR